MKKISKNGCSILSYLGKGIVNVPPEIVWKAVRSPRTRFTYDESLKKVDVVEKVSESINIVNYYHEVQQLFKKESYEFTVLHSERIEGEKYILSMESVVKNITRTEGTTELKVLPSGWIIEPVQKNKKTFSMVTYLMQIDSGAVGADKAAFEELVSKQPLSIAFLRNYLKPAIMLTRRNSSLT